MCISGGVYIWGYYCIPGKYTTSKDVLCTIMVSGVNVGDEVLCQGELENLHSVDRSVIEVTQ